jgi:hypothetical protein
MNKSGGRQPAVARTYDRCAVRSGCDSATSEHTTRSSGRQPAVGEANALAQKNEFVVRGERQNQERRASARRGSQTAQRRQSRLHSRMDTRRPMGNKGSIVGGVITFPAHVRHSNHGWLTPAALDSDIRMRLHRNASCSADSVACHGGLTPPALVLVCGRLPMEKRFLRCRNAHYQERRASARRGVSDVLAQENEFVVRGERQNQERRASARRGSQAAFATATVYRGVIAFLAHDRHQASDGEQGKHSGG